MGVSSRLLSLAAVALLVASPVAAQTPNPSGHWEGAITVQENKLVLAIDLLETGGAYIGAVDIPSQEVKGLPLTRVSRDGLAITFQMVQSAPGDNTFTGALSPDGQTISGTLTHDVYTMPFAVTRTGAARVSPPARSTAIDAALEGTWSGTLTSDGKTRRVSLRLAKAEDGTATGVLVAHDQGGVEIPVATVTQTGNTLALDVRSIGGRYSGAFSADRSMLEGTWTQGTVTLPLTFRHAASDGK